MAENDKMVVVILKDVEFERYGQVMFTTNVRVWLYTDENDNAHRQLECEHTCAECSVANWIVVGTDPGEYRCSNCTSWL